MDAEARLWNARSRLNFFFASRNEPVRGWPDLGPQEHNRSKVWALLGTVRRLEQQLGLREGVDYGTCPDCLR